MALGTKLKTLLDKKGITIKDFAKQIDVAPTTLYSFIKRDSDTARIDLLAKICSGLGMEIDDFLDTQPTDIELDYVMKVMADSAEKERQARLLAYFSGYTEDELSEIKKFAEFVKSQRKITKTTSIPKNTTSSTTVNAAHADDYANAPEELKKQEEDIMDDENF